MFEQYGTDYTNPALQLNDLLPAVNRSEASNSILSTLFQRWLTKPNLANVAGTVGFSRTTLAGKIQEATANRQAYQLYPVFYREQGDQKIIADWNDILRKLQFTGVDPTTYDQWGTTASFDFRPPINFDKFVNYSNYYWVNEVDTIEQPNYVTIAPNLSRTNDWSYSTTASPMVGGWVHKNDIGGRLAYAKQAQLPIIEFEDIEMCRWYKVIRTWRKFDVVLGEYVDTTEQPDWASIDFPVPSLGFSSTVDTDWQLLSETLVPVGDVIHRADGVTISLVPPPTSKMVCQYVSKDDANQTARFEIRTSVNGTIRQYLREQNNIIVFLGDQYTQIVNFTEVEDPYSGQYGSQVDIPLSALGGAAPETLTTLYAYVGAQNTYELVNRQVSKKLIKLADGFTSFTPTTGLALESTQYRDLYEYKLLGQRKLTKYQLPLFNLYSLVQDGDTGMYAERTTAGYIVRYSQDAAQPIDVLLGQRVSTTADLTFLLDLVSPAGELLTYKRNDVAVTADVDAHYTVWRGKPSTSGIDVPTLHTPSFVDATRTPLTDKTLPGGWEPSRLLTSNPLRETRSQFRFSEVIGHFQQLALNQPGTITISDDGGNYLVSSLLSDNLSIPALIDFVSSELYTFRTQFEQRVKMQMFENTALRTTPTSQLAAVIYNNLRSMSLMEGGANSVYDDTTSYDSATGNGYPNYPLTFCVLGLTAPAVVSVEADRKLNHSMIVTHDGTRYALSIAPRECASLEKALTPSIVVGASPSPTVNYSIWQKSSVETYRFECYYFTSSSPTVPSAGQTWYNPTTGQANVWTGAAWQGISADVLWVPFNVAEIVLEVFALQEQDLLKLIQQRNLPVIDFTALHSTQYYQLLTTEYSDFAYRYQLRDFTDQSVGRLLSPPSAVDPFSWYYGNIYPDTPSVYALYTALFNTPVPHKHPWKLQGQPTKPTWWDAEYADLSGARVWSTQMWTNIKAGIVPYGRQLADGTIGAAIPNQVPGYAVIPVNCTSDTYYNYAPDDLLPPYIDTRDQTYNTSADPMFVHPLLSYTLIPAVDPGVDQNPVATIGQYLIFPTTYGNGSFIENIWNTNSTSISRQLQAAYSINPLSVATKLTGRNRKLVGGLSLNAATNNVVRNTDPLHGENGTVDMTLFSALTFLSRRHNFAAQGTSPLQTWKTWSTRLAYQTNSLIVPQTLKVYQDCYDLNEYSIVLKKTENVRHILFSNIIVTLHSIGDPSLSTGRGENWTFKLSCSEVDPTVRRRYALLQQEMVWNTISKTFVVNNPTESFRWLDGEVVQLVNPPASITTNVFYVSSVGGLIRLYTTIADAVAATNAVDFDGVFTGPVQFRTTRGTFTAGNQAWETVEVDRRSVIRFSFADNILLTGVQNVIDFIVSYTEYMQDDGIVINAGETAAHDPDTNAVISWQQQITKAVDKIFASNGLSTNGYQPVFVPDATGKLRPITADRMYIDTPFVEINPFRNAIYFNTPDGVICDFNHTPYVNEMQSKAAVYDDTATAISSVELVPLRTDRLTSVVFNDTQPARPVNVSQDISRRIAFGEISLDFYEHAIVFDQQTSNGLTIFDRFFNLQKSFLNVEFQKSVDFYYRPVMGGFAVTDTGTLPNFETVADYQRNDYDVAESNELVQSTIDSRQMLGKLPLSYFQNIPVTSKTEFQFWQQMVREKGTKGAITAFTRHQLYDEVKYDEFWAWKLGTFGATVPRKQLEMALKVGDALQTANTFYFADTAVPTSAFPIHQIKPLDQTRWIDFPNYLDQVGQDGVKFNQTVTESVEVQAELLDEVYFILKFEIPGDTFTVTYNGEPVTDFAVINHECITVNQNIAGEFDTNDLPIFVVTGYLPSYEQVSPVRVVDTSSKVVAKTMPVWDPANGLHTNALSYFDYVTSDDPAQYNRTRVDLSSAPWGKQQVGQYWLDSNTLLYKPYFDNRLFAFDERTGYWGELADGGNVVAYQWVESNTAPTIASVDHPLTRNIVFDRSWSKVPFGGAASQTVFNAGWTMPNIFTDGASVMLYKDPLVDPSEVDAFAGIEYTLHNISGDRTQFSLMSNGTVLTLPANAVVDGLYLLSTWNDALPSRLDDISCVLYACDHTSTVRLSDNQFQLPWTNDITDISKEYAYHDLTSSAVVVNINGISCPFSITSTGVLSLLDVYGDAAGINDSDIITVRYTAQAVASVGQPVATAADVTYVTTEVPYVEHTQVINQLSVTKYYYWAALPTSTPTKDVPLETAIAAITRPQTGNYMAIHTDRQALTVWGLFGTHQLASKALAIDFDVTMRDKYVSPSQSKVTNEQWVLFREYQDGYPNAQIWDSVASTVIGTRTVNPTSTIIIPSPDRVSYDYLYDTSLSYGTGLTQSLIPPVRARELFTEFFSAANPLVDSTLHALLSGTEWTTLIVTKQYAAALDFVYKYLPATLLNSFIFVVLREGMYSGYHYDGIFKTSFVALQTSQKVVVG